MRSKARECAFKVIFASEFGGGESRRAVYRAEELDEEEKEYADRLVRRHRCAGKQQTKNEKKKKKKINEII